MLNPPYRKRNLKTEPGPVRIISYVHTGPKHRGKENFQIPNMKRNLKMRMEEFKIMCAQEINAQAGPNVLNFKISLGK